MNFRGAPLRTATFCILGVFSGTEMGPGPQVLEREAQFVWPESGPTMGTVAVGKVEPLKLKVLINFYAFVSP